MCPAFRRAARRGEPIPYFVVYKQERESQTGTVVHVVAANHAFATQRAAVMARLLMTVSAAIFRRIVRQPMPNFQIVAASTVREAIEKVA
jgi:hypothetical protein